MEGHASVRRDDDVGAGRHGERHQALLLLVLPRREGVRADIVPGGVSADTIWT